MSIILKENEWAETMIQSNNIGDHPFRTIRLVARYYLDQGYSEEEVRSHLRTFLSECGYSSTSYVWSVNLKKLLNRAEERQAIEVDMIHVTNTEMKKIDSLKSVRARRLAFTLLCLAKYWNLVNPINNSWVHNDEREILELANLNVDSKQRASLYHTLLDEGFLKFSKKISDTSVRILYVDENDTGEIACQVSDFRNLGYQYLKYHGEPYMECQNCGLTIKIDHPNKWWNQKYCKKCAKEIAAQQVKNFVPDYKIEKLYSVYMHECPNHKKYVGTTSTSLSRRWRKGNGYVHNRPFYDDIQEYGWENIKHYKIAAVSDKGLAEDIKCFYIQKYHTTSKEHGYNNVSDISHSSYSSIILSQYVPEEVSENKTEDAAKKQ